MFSRFLCIVIVVFQYVVPVFALPVDPTKPSYYKIKNSKKSYQLESVLISDTRKVAVINGAIVAEGDRIDGAKVIEIDKGKVRLDSAEKIIELILQTVTVRQDN